MLSKMEQQIILYTKNWFKKTNTIDDLKVIIGNGYKIELQHLDSYNVYNCIIRLYLKTIPENMFKFRMKNFFSNLYKYEKIDSGVTIEKMIEEMCEELSNLRVQEGDQVLFELGEPDYSLLPKREESTTHHLHSNEC